MVTGGSNVRRIARCSSDVSQSHLYNTKIADLIRRNTMLQDQLATALASKDQLEKSLSSVIQSREQLEKMLASKDKEAEILKEKIAALELAQEESNSLSNTVHADNVRLEREVAFLKAVTDETQKARQLDILLIMLVILLWSVLSLLVAGAAFHSQGFGGRTVARVPAPGTPFEIYFTHSSRN